MQAFEQEQYSSERSLQQNIKFIASKTPLLKCKDGVILLDKYNPNHACWFEDEKERQEWLFPEKSI